MSQSPNNPKPKMASDAMFEIPHLEDTDEVTNYFNLTIQSVWGTIVSMVETQRRMLKQIQTIRHNYNLTLITTEEMLKKIHSSYVDSHMEQKQSNATNILLGPNSSSQKDNAPTNSNSSVNGDKTKVTSKSAKTKENAPHIKNLWIRK